MKNKTFILSQKRFCPVCDDRVHGRTDKIYCCSKCKDKHYAKNRKDFLIDAKVVLKQQARNHFVLDLFGGDSDHYTISLAALQDKGFDPNFVTGIEHNKFGQKFKLFNYCWYQANTQNIVVYRNKKETPLSPYTYKRWVRHHEHLAQTFVDGRSDDYAPS